MLPRPMPATRGTAAFLPQFLLLLMIAIWGGSYAVVKNGLDELSPFALVSARFWLAVFCILPFVWGSGFAARMRATRKAGIVTGCALATGYLLQTVGMSETSASMGGFLAGLIVLLVGVGGWLLFHERLSRQGVTGLLLGLLGMVLLCWPHGYGIGGPKDTAFGVGMQIGSSISYACHILLISRLSPRGAVLPYCLWQLAVVAIAGSVCLLCAGSVVSAPVPAPTGHDPGLWSANVVFAILYLGILATALGIGVQSRVQPQIRPTHVALLFATQPLFAAVAGWLVRGDTMTAMQFTGGGCIVTGIVVASRAR
jgi:drug/metabolite transporter (DMT)-like permease